MYLKVKLLYQRIDIEYIKLKSFILIIVPNDYFYIIMSKIIIVFHLFHIFSFDRMYISIVTITLEVFTFPSCLHHYSNFL